MVIPLSASGRLSRVSNLVIKRGSRPLNALIATALTITGAPSARRRSSSSSLTNFFQADDVEPRSTGASA
jgi:hypothetical protein